MSSQRIATRYRALREMMSEHGILWDSDPAYLEFVHKASKLIVDEPMRNATVRYYLAGESQQVDEYGRSAEGDARFYHLVQQGRTVLLTVAKALRRADLLGLSMEHLSIADMTDK